MSDTLTTEKTHCNVCGHETNHQLVIRRMREGNELTDDYPPISLSWSITSDLLECLGCSEVTLRRTVWFSEWEDNQVDYYPPRVSRRSPKWQDKLPRQIADLLKEVYVAVHAGSRRLAMIGTRTLIDLVILEKVGDVGTFEKKVRTMVEKGYLSAQNSKVLTAALDAGNAAAHRGHLASAEELELVLDITENLLQAVYICEPAADLLRAATPPRAKQSPQPTV